MDNEKQELIDILVPKAVLKAVTDKAKRTILKRANGLDVIPILDYPFKIGREARVTYVNDEPVLQERHKLGGDAPNNDAYLLDNNQFLQISRIHCSIVQQKDRYVLVDRGSECGCMVNQFKVGDGANMNCPLEDGDIITIGSQESQYKFKFISLDLSN